VVTEEDGAKEVTWRWDDDVARVKGAVVADVVIMFGALLAIAEEDENKGVVTATVEGGAAAAVVVQAVDDGATGCETW